MDINLNFNTVFNLADIRELTANLTLDEKRLIVEQALLLIDGVYAHLPLKMAQYAINPVQRLKLLLERLDKLEHETQFHKELLEIFTSLRDGHTNYIQPEPMRQFTAFLPFEIEEYFTESEPHYIVSKITPDSINHSTFIIGVEVTHWNGVPIRRAIQDRAKETIGSNSAARHAQAIKTITTRSLGHMLPPKEDWVVITYKGSKGQEHLRVVWQAFRVIPASNAMNPNDSKSPQALMVAIDEHMNVIQRAKKMLFAPQAMTMEQKIAAADSPEEMSVSTSTSTSTSTRFPDSLEYYPVDTPSGKFGYLRLRSFSTNDPQAFVDEVIRVVKLLPPEGLIIDARDNPGGNLVAGEALSQLFTDKKIQPLLLSFRNTGYTRFLVENNLIINDDGKKWVPFEQWQESIKISIETGEIYSQGFSFFPGIDWANTTGRIYPGKVILIVNALSYSTTDFLAVSFRDNQVGKILGTDTNIGAGGAQVITHQWIFDALKSASKSQPWKVLPKGTEMRVALRRATRVGRNTLGSPIEGFGIQPDAIHRMTSKDLLEKNVDLIAKAGELLVQEDS